jgi:hypothetical protein
VNIPSKPTPEGFKIWVLGNEGYILDWLWHAKGNKKGPVDLDTSFTKKEGLSKTQAVVLDLLTQRNKETNAQLYLPGKHIVCSIIYLQALSFLHNYGSLVLEVQEPFEQPKQSVRSRGTWKATFW